MLPVLLLPIVFGSFFAEGCPSNESEQINALLKRLESLETKLNRTDGMLKDLTYIMMCAWQDHWTSTGIIPYDKLTLEYTNCDRPGTVSYSN